MPRPRLTDDDLVIITKLLRETVEYDPFPLSPRIKSLKAILDKLVPPLPRPVPRPPPKPPSERSMITQIVTADDARRWLVNVGTFQRTKARFVELVSDGVPDGAVIGEHVTQEEAEALFARVCSEVGIDPEVFEYFVSLDTDELLATARRVYDLVGTTPTIVKILSSGAI
jgi:hypothetical protein